MIELISIIVPAHNEEKYIASCLEALQKQDFPKDKYEILIVNNLSTDKTREIAESMGVAVADFSLNKGVGPSRQEGVKKASGQIIAFTDADTKPETDWLKKLSKDFEDPNVIGVGGKVLPEGAGVFTLFLFELYGIFLKINLFFGKPLPWGNNMAIRRDNFEKVGGFNLNLATSEDWDIALRLQKQFPDSKFIYNTKLKVLTSNRKQASARVFLSYFWDSLNNYLNVVILGKAKSKEMKIVR